MKISNKVEHTSASKEGFLVAKIVVACRRFFGFGLPTYSFSIDLFYLIFIFVYIWFYLLYAHTTLLLQVSPRFTFRAEVEIKLLLNSSFLDHAPTSLVSSVCPPIEFDMVSTHSTVSNLLPLDLLSLSTNQRDVFCVVSLAVLA